MISSDNFLINHAYDNVWCGPGQDRQHILAPTRITTGVGATWTVLIGLTQYNLPKPGITYDVFTFGDLLPETIGMDNRTNIWISAKAHCEAKKLMIHLYNKNGVHYPLAQAWFLYTRNGNLVIAIERLPKLPNFSRESIFVRWRSAAWFSTDESNGRIAIKCGYLKFNGNDADYATFRQEWIAHRDLPYGKGVLFVNGRRVRNLVVNSLVLGDHLEFIFDGDIKEVVELPYSALLGFNSSLDGVNKFLIPRKREDDEVDFVDDMDFYILNYTKPAEFTGIYFHQNRTDAIRMVTHKDYALNAQYVHSALSDQGWLTNQDIRVEVITRYSGMNRSLIFEHHRIKELLKLPEDKRLGAMIGDDAGVPVWTADSLESSMYLKIMRMKIGEITEHDVIEAYGYNMVARLTGLVPIKVTPGISHVDLFYGQYTQSTVYEYDEQRRLIGWYPHEQFRQYPLKNANCRLVEAYAGIGGMGLSTIYNSHQATTPPVLKTDRNYRFYVGRIRVDETYGDWRDVTGDDSVYTIVDNTVVWGELAANAVTAIRNDRDFLSKDIELSSADGILLFSVGAEEVFPGKQNTYVLLDIPPGEIDLFLNGYGLVEDVDYYVNWPEICIVSKRYWLNTPTQKVTIRARGFCKSDMSWNTDGESGLIIHNQLSRNGRYNVRDDKVTRVSLGGGLYTLDEVGFAEDGTLTVGVANGLPYRITHPYIPLTPIVPGDTYGYREQSLVVDKSIEGYMDIHYPEPPISGPIPIPDRYVLVSPFMSKVIEDVLQGFITMDDFEGEYSQYDVAARLDGYSYLLDYDPVLRETRTDFFTFHPHRHASVELNRYQLRFLDMAVQVFLFGRIELNRYVTIAP